VETTDKGLIQSLEEQLNGCNDTILSHKNDISLLEDKSEKIVSSYEGTINLLTEETKMLKAKLDDFELNNVKLNDQISELNDELLNVPVVT
jgi:chromosome segregation ATPase